MQPESGRSALAMLAPVVTFLLLACGVAQAEQRYIRLSNDTERTLIWCAVILAAGMVIAAAILRRPK